MNTAEQTIEAIVRIGRREPTAQERLRLVMPYVSQGSREELQRVSDDYGALMKANRHLAIALADAHDEIARLRGERIAA